MSKRAYNFSPGPSMLPQAVIEQIQRDLLNWQDSGMSVMELSHRSESFLQVAEEAEQNLRELLKIPANYQVLFLHGGASLQSSAIPLNLAQNHQADYIITGQWGQKALEEAQRFIQTSTIIDTSQQLRAPKQDELIFNDQADYVHYTPNETILGIEFHYTPETKAIPLVADMSSNILSRPIKVEDFAVIYAGSQKNISVSGLGLVIVREDLINQPSDRTPALLSWQIARDHDCMFNTPNTFAWYVAGEVFKWLKQQGGVIEIEKANIKKAQRLYAFIDASDFYHNPVAKDSRSNMNIPFTLADESCNQAFLQQAQQRGLTNLKGHQMIGGMRASIYNAMPLAGVEALIEFMHQFEGQASLKHTI